MKVSSAREIENRKNRNQAIYACEPERKERRGEGGGLGDAAEGSVVWLIKVVMALLPINTVDQGSIMHLTKSI